MFKRPLWKRKSRDCFYFLIWSSIHVEDIAGSITVLPESLVLYDIVPWKCSICKSSMSQRAKTVNFVKSVFRGQLYKTKTRDFPHYHIYHSGLGVQELSITCIATENSQFSTASPHYILFGQIWLKFDTLISHPNFHLHGYHRVAVSSSSHFLLLL